MLPLDFRIEAALATRDEDRRWELIGSTIGEDSGEGFELAASLLSSGVERRRRLGADMLGRLVDDAPAFAPRALPMLIEALGTETKAGPLASIVAALGHVGDSAAMESILRLADHAYPDVRLAVAYSLASIGPRPPSGRTVETLIRLSRDRDAEVRDWATFGLGTLSQADGPDVRDALLARAEDAYPEARAEALFGLAVRHDPRGVPPLIRALAAPTVGHLEVDAAAEAADPRLLPALRRLHGTRRADAHRVEHAISRCEGTHAN